MDVSNERRSPGNCLPSTKPQIRAVTPPLRYSPKSVQPLQPVQTQQPPLPPTTLPFSTHLSSLTSSNVHLPSNGPSDVIVDQHAVNNVPATPLQHHYTPTTSQPSTTFPPSRHPLPLSHSQYSSPSHYPQVVK